MVLITAPLKHLDGLGWVAVTLVRFLIDVVGGCEVATLDVPTLTVLVEKLDSSKLLRPLVFRGGEISQHTLVIASLQMFIVARHLKVASRLLVALLNSLSTKVELA